MLLKYKWYFSQLGEMGGTQEKMVTKLGPEGQVSDSYTSWEAERHSRRNKLKKVPEQRKSVVHSKNCNCYILLRLEHGFLLFYFRGLILKEGMEVEKIVKTRPEECHVCRN
jgi:hypothetical protein